MLDLRKLEIFYAVTQAGSFSAAAEQLYLTQAAVSQHIKDLETGLGRQLFKRGRRGVHLTTAGEILLEYTTAILQLLAEAEAAITDVAHLPSGQIRIGATPGIGTYVLPTWMQDFRHAYPRLTLALTTDTTNGIAQRIRHHQLEIGFIEGDLPPTADIQQVVLQAVPQVVVVGQNHAWFGVQSIPIADLAGQAIITRPIGSHTRHWLETLLKNHHITPQVVAEFDSPTAIKQAVMAGMGISVLPEYDVVDDIERGLLYGVAVQDAVLERELRLIWHTTHPFNPITRAFLGILAESYPNLAVILGND